MSFYDLLSEEEQHKILREPYRVIWQDFSVMNGKFYEPVKIVTVKTLEQAVEVAEQMKAEIKEKRKVNQRVLVELFDKKSKQYSAVEVNNNGI